MAKQDPSESRAAAEQFRRNSHRDNAANPQFKAAQSHVLAAAIEAKTRFTQKVDRDRFIERAKETVAKRIEVGAPVPAALRLAVGVTACFALVELLDGDATFLAPLLAANMLIRQLCTPGLVPG